ncbi:MAG: imidazole glycerol phosphate synthase subunit HisF [Eubacterium sp.]|nr:imidazole glycerol phosphate synthase subunit HisF [Eubacterium sp.]
MFDRPRVIPCLLIQNKNMVKTKYFKNPNYLGDPINAVKIYNEKMVDELCILDITRNKKEIDFDYLYNIATEAFMPLSYGGGIETIEQIKELFWIGFEKVVINTSLVKNPVLIEQAVSYAGSQSIVASIDVKKTIFGKQKCFIKCGSRNTGFSPISLAKRAEELGVGEILLNSIDCDGMMKGYDLRLIREISANIRIPLIACGGAGRISDLKEAIEAGANAVAAGSMFVYYGENKAVLINYPDEKEMIKAELFL